MIGLKEKVAVVTGGSSGIGAACAHRLVDEGAFVIVAGRSEARAKEVCETSSAPERASYVLGDVRRVAYGIRNTRRSNCSASFDAPILATEQNT